MATVSFDPLDRVVTLLDAAFREGGWHQPNFLVMVDADDGEAFDLGAKPLPEGSHPLDHLLGFVAPASWSAFGAVCFGRVVPGDRRARVVTLVARSGETYAVTTLDDGTVIDEPGEGAIIDALHRCLGLPTPPPPFGMVDWGEVRRTVAAGATAGAGMSADIAAWMDDGMFARWILNDQPPRRF